MEEIKEKKTYKIKLSNIEKLKKFLSKLKNEIKECHQEK